MKLRGLFAIVLSVMLLLGLLAAVAAADELTTAIDPEWSVETPALAEPDSQAGIDVVATQYTFSSSSGTYTPIVTGTVHGTASNDDTSFPAIDIGFTFRYNNVDYTQVSIQSNGWIAMGPAIASSYYPLSTGTYNNVIAALARDLQGNGTTSELRSLMEGTAPNRVFIVQWTDYKRYGSSYVGDSFDFQIRLYETSNLVEVVYGDFTVLYVATPPYGPQVGLRGKSNADFNNRTMDATQSWATSVAGTTNADSMTLTDLIYPASGLTYDWSLATGLFLDPTAQSGGACPGSDVVYNLDVINQTGVAQAFNLAYTSVWPASGPAATGAIANGYSELISPTVHIPWAANVGDTDVMTVTATDATSTYTAQATATTAAALVSGYTDYANVPVGREVRAPGVVYYDGKLYKIGGYGYVGGTGAARAWLDIYDIATDTWTSGADMPGARYWIDCEAISGKIYCAGGYLSSGQTALYIYDIATDTWTTGANPLPAYRYNYASVQLGGKYYLIGGYAAGVTATMIVYDPATDTWDSTLASMNVARRYFHAGVIGGKIYVAGGYGATSPYYLSSAEVYDPATDTWSYVASMPSNWVNAADGVKHDRFLILTGGSPSSTSGASNGAMMYDAQADTWSWLPLLDRLLYSAEGDGDGTMFWTVSGRMYDGAWSNSPYTTLLDQCEECVPVSGADFTVDPTVPRPNMPATFTGSVAAGSPAITWEWSFGDGAYGSGQVVQHTYNVSGTYTVVMTATNCDGASTSVATDTVSVEPGPLIIVDPLSLESTQCPDSLMTYTLTICNDGDLPLTWSLTELLPILSLGEQPGKAAQVPASGGNPNRLGSTPPNRTQIPLFVQPEADVIVDGSFEAGTPNPYWNEYSSNFGTPLCTVAACGTGLGTGPRTGIWWSWFGGITAVETGWMSQTLTIPTGTALLSFWLEVPYCTDPAGYMSVLIDGTTLFTVYGNDPLCNLVGYVQQTIDVSAFADGAAHTIAFYGQLFGLNNNFMVDDVVLDVSSDSILWVSEDPTSGTVAAGDCVTVEVTFDSTGMAPGTYTGTLRINSNDTLNPAVDVDLTMIVAGPPTGVDFTYTPPSPWMNEDVTFSGTATALMPVTYAWDFGDGAYGAGQNPTHAYAAAGTYTVYMTATQCGYSVVATDTITILECWSLLSEDFEGAFPPANWSVINNGGTCVWQRNDYWATPRPNYAGADGFCADADSDKCGSGGTMDTELRTMVLDLSTATTATLKYISAYNDIGTGGDLADVDASVDGGATWINLLSWDEDHSAYGPGEAVTINLTQFQGEPSVILRFHYWIATYDWWWEVDQVRVGACIIPGVVPDIDVDPLSLTQMLEVNQTAVQTFNIANLDLGVLNWTLDEGCGTPVDWLSENPTSGLLHAYNDVDVEVTFDSTGLALGAYNTTLCVNSDDPDEPQIQVAVTLIVTGTPDIAVTPSSLETALCQGETDTQYLQICNTGTGTLVWSLAEEEGALNVMPVVPANTLPFPTSPAPERPVITSPDQCAQYENYTGAEPIGAAEFCGAPALPAMPSGGTLAPTDPGYALDIGYISDNFVTFPLNNFSGQTVLGLNATPFYGLDFDPSGTVLYALNDTTDQLGTIDLTTGAFTGLAPCPPGGGAANWTGLAIDPVSGAFYGSTATNLYTIDPTTGNSTLVGPFNAGTMIAIAVNAEGQMYGHDISTDSIYSINTATGAATLIGPTGYLANYAQGMDFDNDDGTLYIFLYIGSGSNVYGTVDLTTGAVTALSTNAPLGEFEGATQTTALVDVPWVTEAPTNGVLLPGECVSVAVTFDSDALPDGVYTADLVIDSNDPDEPEITIPVQLTVGCPDIAVTPSSLEATLCPDTTWTTPLTICNDGILPLTWELTEEPPESALAGSMPFVPVNIEGQATNAELTLSSPARSLATPEQAAHPEAILWDQPLSTVNQNAYVNQDFTDLPTYSSFLADDFVNAEPWDISSIFVPGNGWNGFTTLFNATGLTWQIYADDGTGFPDGDPAGGGNPPLWTLTLAPTDPMVVISNGSGGMPSDTTLNLSSPVTVPPGHWWLVFYPSLPFSGGGQYGRQPADTTNGYTGQFINPGGAFGLGTAWQAWTVLGATQQDIAFRIEGTLVVGDDIPWLSEDPISGTLPPGECVVVDVTFDSTGLAPGIYTGDLLITSNDPDEPEVTIPVQLTVLAPPSGADFSWSPAVPIIYQTVYFSGTIAAGAEPLTWSWDFGDGGTAAGQYASHVYAAPGDYLVTLTVSNECGQDVVQHTVTVIGEADIVVTPSSLSTELCPDTTWTTALTICNDGIIPLDWELTEEPASAVRSTAGGAAPRAPAPGATGSRGGSAGAAQPIRYSSVTSFSEGFDDITVLPGQGWFFQNNSEPLGLTDWFQGNDSVFPAHAGAPTAYIGANYNNTSGVGTISNWMLTPEISLNNGDTISFWTRVPAESTWPDRLELRLSTAGASTNVGTGALDVGDFATLLLSVNPSLEVGGYPEVWTQFSATLSGIPGGATGRIAFRYFVTDAGPSGSNSNYIGVDTVEYVSSPVSDIPWLSEDPISGTVPPGECVVVDVTFDSTGLAPGVYNGDLLITSNDPDTPEVTIPVTMTVLEPAIIADVAYTITGTQVAFDATVTGVEPLTYTWTFGDGGTSSEEDPTHTYVWTGCYTPTLTVSNQCGQDTWWERICVCEAVAGADFTWFPTNPWVGETIDFTGSVAAGSPPLNWHWDFDDGTTAGGQSVLHAFATPGDHLVILTVTNGCGQTSVQHTVTVSQYYYYYYLPIISRNYPPQQ